MVQARDWCIISCPVRPRTLRDENLESHPWIFLESLAGPGRPAQGVLDLGRGFADQPSGDDGAPLPDAVLDQGVEVHPAPGRPNDRHLWRDGAAQCSTQWVPLGS